MNLEELQKIINENNEELEILNSLVSEETEEEARDVKESTDVDEIFKEIKRLNPGVYLELDGAGMASRGITSSVPGNRLNLPEGFEYDDTYGITNRGKTDSGAYASISVRPLEKVKRDRIQEYRGISKEALKERKAFLDEQNGKLNSFKVNAERLSKEIEKLQEELNDPTINDTDKKNKRKERKEKVEELEKEKKEVLGGNQGKTKEVISNILGQNFLHKILYKKDNAWNKHVDRVKERYNHPYKYVFKNLGLLLGTAAVTGLLVSMPVGLGMITSAVASKISLYVGIPWTMSLINVATKGIYTVYNKNKYGNAPEMKRNIGKGKYLECINNAIHGRNIAKSIKNIIKLGKNARIGDKKTERKKNAGSLPEFESSRTRLNEIDYVNNLLISSVTDEQLRELYSIDSALSSNFSILNDAEKENLNKIRTFLKLYNYSKKIIDEVNKAYTKKDDVSNENIEYLTRICDIAYEFIDTLPAGDKLPDEVNGKLRELSNIVNKKNKHNHEVDDSVKNEIYDFISYVNGLNSRNLANIIMENRKSHLDSVRKAVNIDKTDNKDNEPDLLSTVYREYSKLSPEARKLIPPETKKRMLVLYKNACELISNKMRQSKLESLLLEIKELLNNKSTYNKFISFNSIEKDKKLEILLRKINEVRNIIYKNPNLLREVNKDCEATFNTLVSNFGSNFEKFDYVYSSNIEIAYDKVYDTITGEFKYYLAKCVGSSYGKIIDKEIVLENIDEHYVYMKIKEYFPDFDGEINIKPNMGMHK